jgi:hypothetical protein
MRDLWIHENDLIVATHGRSFWILDDIAPLREASIVGTSAAAHLFTPAPAWRIQRDTNTDTPLPPDEPAAANPPDGAVIDYYLPRAASGPVTLEVLDSGGQVVRRYSSADQSEVSDEDIKKQLIPLYWLRPFRALSTEAGMHRWVWDLHYTAPDSMRHEYPIAATAGETPRVPLGPTALPGVYTVRLAANGSRYTAPLTVKMDPRVKVTSMGLQKKFQLESHLASSLTETSRALMAATSMRDPLQTLTQKASGAVHDSIQGFQKKFADLMEPAPPAGQVSLARVNGQISVLYGQVWQVDAEPTVAQSEASAAVAQDASEAVKQWEALKSADLPALNHALHEAGLPELQIEPGKYKEDAVADEE